jgi:uncharacterized protein
VNASAPDETLPLFPLHTVLLPGTHLPLHIFEPRYRQLTIDLMTGARPGRRFGVVAIRSPTVNDVRHIAQVYDIGCVATLREATHRPEGRFDIVTTGGTRFRLVDIDVDSAPYLLGRVQRLPSTPVREGTQDAAAALPAADPNRCRPAPYLPHRFLGLVCSTANCC